MEKISLNKNKLDIKLWIGILISVFFIFLLFRKIDFYKLVAALKEINYLFLLPAILFTYVSYFFRAVRWRFLLMPLKKISIKNLFAATIIGYMANNLLPARLGGFVRAYVLGEKENIETSSVFATLVLDRLFDGFSVILILVVTFFSVKLPAGMERVQQGLVAGGYITLALYCGVILFIFILKKQTIRTLNITAQILRPFPAKFSEKVIPVLGSFIQGLRLSQKASDLFMLIATSVVIWAFAVLALDMVLDSFGIFLPIYASLFIMVFLVFAVMIPASPGYIGTYHAACVYGLMAFNIQLEKAMSVALIVHGVNFFPVIFSGIYYLWRGKLSLADVRKSSQQG